MTASASPSSTAPHRQRVFVGSFTPDGILAYDWDPVSADLVPAGPLNVKLANVDWITFSPDRDFLYAASEVDLFNGKATGAVASFRVLNGQLYHLSAENSAGVGTCHAALDHSGRVLLSADYSGGSAASFLIAEGRLSRTVWTEHYTAHGPNIDRQESAHAHFASVSPDNRFAYINDLGGDSIHIYSLNTATAVMTPAGTYRAKPGSGPRTLHFHPNCHIAYSINELDSTVDVLEWSNVRGLLTLVKRIKLLPEGYHGPTRACDTLISRDGKSVYFANRDYDFLYSFRADPRTGSLTPIGRSNCGGKTPRNFVLDPTEHWILVANQDSNLVSIFARNTENGVLAEECKSFEAAAPMCILFA
ncbi:MAG: lactonase family protein [Terracidiphilus sp.]|jgi:6-phosphogluconolactonase